MSAPVPDVKAATQRAQQELDWLRCHKEASLEAWQEHVRAYVLERFLLDREEEEEEANGGRETISARLKLAGCALAALVLLAYPSIQRFLAGGRSLAECVAEVIVRLMVVACVVFPVWRTVKRRQEENGTV